MSQNKGDSWANKSGKQDGGSSGSKTSARTPHELMTNTKFNNHETGPDMYFMNTKEYHLEK